MKMNRIGQRARRAIIGGAVGAACCAAGQSERAGPYITREEPHDWVVTATVSLTPATEVEARRRRPGASLNESQSDDIEPSARFDIEQATFFWPITGEGAGYDVDRRSVVGSLSLGGNEVRTTFTLLDSLAGGEPLHSGAAYGQWTFGPLENVAASGVITVTQNVRTWNTRFDETAAKKVEWPKGGWPAAAEASLEPMLFIDESFEGPYTKSRVPDLVDRFTRGNARSQPPVVTAKWIAGEVLRSFRMSGQAAVPDIVPGTAKQSGQSVGAINAINTAGVEAVSRSGRGSGIDLALLLTACYREAGLPARLVIGYVVEPANAGEDIYRRADKAERGLYAWVEFALYDERQTQPGQALTWVPVDVIAMHRNNVARKPFDQAWDGFGTSEQSFEILPLAYHLHPHRLGAIAYGVSQRREPLPGLWGWNVVPAAPQAVRQSISISATSASRTTNEPERGDR